MDLVELCVQGVTKDAVLHLVNYLSFIFTSETRALAALEYLVHVPMAIVPTDLSIVQLNFPYSILPLQVEISSLPPNWRDYPPPQTLGSIGTKWIMSNQSLLLRVPSSVIEQDYSILINPAHHEFNLIEVLIPEPFVFDSRLLLHRT
ncbi:MAG: RES domain-containing protein [Chloroflexota bacterium]|nr:RES domain-containing protein [Chloroflexota bacterium]